MDALFTFLPEPAIDIIIIALFLFGGFLWGMARGRAKLLSMLFAVYLTLFMGPNIFAFLSHYNISPGGTLVSILYGVLLVFLFIFFDNAVFASAGKSPYPWWKALFVSFLTVGLFVAGSLNILEFGGIIEISPITEKLFSGTNAYFFWSFAPLFGLWFLTR